MTNLTIIRPNGDKIQTSTQELQDATRVIEDSSARAKMGGKRDITQEAGLDSATGKRVLSFIERIERLESERRDLADDIKQIYGELKAVGFDAPTIRRLVRLRRLEDENLKEQTELLRLYATAIGMEEQLCLF